MAAAVGAIKFGFGVLLLFGLLLLETLGRPLWAICDGCFGGIVI